MRTILVAVLLLSHLGLAAAPARGTDTLKLPVDAQLFRAFVEWNLRGLPERLPIPTRPGLHAIDDGAKLDALDSILEGYVSAGLLAPTGSSPQIYVFTQAERTAEKQDAKRQLFIGKLTAAGVDKTLATAIWFTAIALSGPLDRVVPGIVHPCNAWIGLSDIGILVAGEEMETAIPCLNALILSYSGISTSWSDFTATPPNDVSRAVDAALLGLATRCARSRPEAVATCIRAQMLNFPDYSSALIQPSAPLDLFMPPFARRNLALLLEPIPGHELRLGPPQIITPYGGIEVSEVHRIIDGRGFPLLLPGAERGTIVLVGLENAKANNAAIDTLMRHLGVTAADSYLSLLRLESLAELADPGCDVAVHGNGAFLILFEDPARIEQCVESVVYRLFGLWTRFVDYASVPETALTRQAEAQYVQALQPCLVDGRPDGKTRQCVLDSLKAASSARTPP
jgi:hypothetical protein